MKRLVYLITLVVIATSLVLKVQGQLPDRLPIGDAREVGEYTITNNFWLKLPSMQLSYKKEGALEYVGVSSAAHPWTLNSYDDFESYLKSEGMRLLGLLNQFDVGMKSADIFAYSSVLINLPDGRKFFPLDVGTFIGTFDTITPSSFLNLPQIYAGVIVPVDGLEKFELWCGDSKSDPEWTTNFWYTYTPNDSKIHKLAWGGIRDYCADTNILNLNQAFVQATNKIRFEVTAKGQKAIYTQHGDMIRPALLRMFKDRCAVSYPRGADVIVQYSTDNIHWFEFRKLSWSLGTRFTSFPISTGNDSMMFYRALVQ